MYIFIIVCIIIHIGIEKIPSESMVSLKWRSEELMQIYDMRELGEQIRQQRDLLALTQGEAAGLTGVSLRLWSEVERGQRDNVSFSTVLRMVQTLGIDLSLVTRGQASAERSDTQKAAAP